MADDEGRRLRALTGMRYAIRNPILRSWPGKAGLKILLENQVT
jgi:hypothetical protein